MKFLSESIPASSAVFWNRLQIVGPESVSRIDSEISSGIGIDWSNWFWNRLQNLWVDLQKRVPVVSTLESRMALSSARLNRRQTSPSPWHRPLVVAKGPESFPSTLTWQVTLVFVQIHHVQFDKAKINISVTSLISEFLKITYWNVQEQQVFRKHTQMLRCFIIYSRMQYLK